MTDPTTLHTTPAIGQTKRCTKCGEVKPLSEFHKNRTKKDGLMGACKACAAERNRKYREEHPEKVAEKDRKYREEHREELAEKDRKYREEHPEKVAEWNRKYREEHPKKEAERKRKYREEHREELAEKDRKYREEHPEKVAEWNRKYREEHPEKEAEWNRKSYEKRLAEKRQSDRHVCYACGKVFYSTNPSAKYCSKQCYFMTRPKRGNTRPKRENFVCKTLKKHREDLKDDPDRLSSDFLRTLIGGKADACNDERQE